MMRKGMTLIEIVITITLMAILVGVYFVVANPAGQLASSRNSERFLHLQAIMNAVTQNVADQGNRQFSCSSGPLSTSTKRMTSTAGAGNYNIAPCLVPTYLAFLPFDPSTSSARYNSVSDYDTGYTISINASGTVITLKAPAAELGKTISVSGW
jgi:prepilin-type N-terminal cleavage/methylation domain-containing protein